MENITKVASRAPHSKMNFALQCPENEGGMNERVKRLHQQSIDTPATLTIERALIETAFYKEWEEAYHAGVFTEFMEQRAGGHTSMDGKMY